MNDIAEKLKDPLWRLNNLYYIVDKNGSKCKFKLNWAQEDLYKNMWYCNIILKARQLGISTFICLLFLDRCIFNENVAAGIIAHTIEDAQHMFKRIKLAYDCLPEQIKALIPASTENARELIFSNGSSLRVGTSMRGSTFQYLHISEFGKICAKYPEKAREIITGSLNTLSAGQYVFIESTAEGRSGYFYDMCKEAQTLKQSNKKLSKLDFRFHFFPWWKHDDYVLKPEGVRVSSDLEDYFKSLKIDYKISLSPEQKAWYAKKSVSQKEDMMREFPSTPEESFYSSNEGLYYGRHMARARIEKRIRKVYHDPNLPVYVAMDLGYADATSLWFFQVAGQEIRLLEYYEKSGEPLTYYLKYIKDKPYSISKYFTPHDAGTTEYSSGLSRADVAASHGVNFTVLPRLEVIDGINAVRNMLERCYFDEEKCDVGIRHLEAYSKQWNVAYGCWNEKPRHDNSSHCADAFRYLAQSLSQAAPSSGLNIEEYRRLKEQHGYAPPRHEYEPQMSAKTFFGL